MRRQLRQRLLVTNQLRNSKHLSSIRNLIQSPKIWHVTRRSVARAVAVGIFVAYLPMPFQMLVAALLAVVVRANLPISVLLIWISNPFTWLILYGPPYILGAAILGQPEISIEQLSISWLTQNLSALWVGCLIVGGAMATGGYITVQILWRMEVVGEWEKRRNKLRVKRESQAEQNDKSDI
ncbi:MAG: hypothetical protein ACI89S_002349 [Gammaproteobacteria bacterium]|jgi:uncharacterized protein (DUF2062 family)